MVPYLIVVHRPAGGYKQSEGWLCNPTAEASAHILTDSNREAVQLVPWHRKAWAAASFNSASYNVEVDDDAWNGKDPAALATAARVVAYLAFNTGIPPAWTRNPTHTPGVLRHLDLGRAGGGHSDPTTDTNLWVRFLSMVKAEHTRGGFRKVYGVGDLTRIDV